MYTGCLRSLVQYSYYDYCVGTDKTTTRHTLDQENGGIASHVVLDVEDHSLQDCIKSARNINNISLIPRGQQTGPVFFSPEVFTQQSCFMSCFVRLSVYQQVALWPKIAFLFNFKCCHILHTSLALQQLAFAMKLQIIKAVHALKLFNWFCLFADLCLPFLWTSYFVIH